MKKILLLLLIFASMKAQYKSDFKDLIQTTYNRTFDKSIILEYLNSSDKEKVKAALLSIANSGNKSFIKDIIKLDSDKLLNEKVFALGKLGADSLSENFLMKNIDNVDENFNSQRIFFEALGSLISKDNFSELLLSNKDYVGFPFSIVSAVARKLEFNKDTLNNYLLNNLESPNSNLVFASLYALYRIFPPAGSEDYFISTLNKEYPSWEKEIKAYALGCLRRLKRFPVEKNIFQKLFADEDWRIRTELARTAVFSARFNENSDMYFKLLIDENPNVSRQAAISLRDLKPGTIKKTKLDSILQNKLTKNTLGELLVTYSHLFPEESERLIDEFSTLISRKFIFEIIDNIKDAESRFNLLSEELMLSSARDRIYLAGSFLKLQDEYRRDKKYSKILISLLRENNAPVISIISDGLNEDFVIANSSLIQEVILDHLFSKVNDSNYLESIQSLYRLSSKISQQFEMQTKEIISNSKTASIKQIATGNVELKNDTMFNTIFNEAFNYSEAVITTNKGQFTFEFLPEVAPISVGNFCYLAKKSYFNENSFHRAVPNFVIQTGDSTSTGWGGPGYDIISEFSSYPFETGFVGMASAGKDTEGSQWFVMHNFYPHLNTNYTVFGKIINGQNVVDFIDQDDVVIFVELIK